MPRYELLIAIDQLQAKGFAVNVRELNTVPQSVRERGGWWSAVRKYLQALRRWTRSRLSMPGPRPKEEPK